jgi:hypothetical protein
MKHSSEGSVIGSFRRGAPRDFDMGTFQSITAVIVKHGLISVRKPVLRQTVVGPVNAEASDPMQLGKRTVVNDGDSYDDEPDGVLIWA